ncbi:MAG TPA: hypothetical protein VG710_07970 [Opitutus sp.]|nr:hypothetical protein [Opitutus sp.]
MRKLPLVALVSIFVVGCSPDSELEKTKSDLAAAQLKIKSLELDLARAQFELKQAETDTDSLQSVAANPRQLPIRVWLHRTDRHGAFRLVIKNQSAKTAGLHVVVSAVGKWQDLTPFIESGKIWTIDRLASGDKIQISCDGYDSQSFVVQ